LTDHPSLDRDAATEKTAPRNEAFVFRGGGSLSIVVGVPPAPGPLAIARDINGSGIAAPADLAFRVSGDEGVAVVDLGSGDRIALVGVAARDVAAAPETYFRVV
jgi:hypothetical protein